MPRIGFRHVACNLASGLVADSIRMCGEWSTGFGLGCPKTGRRTQAPGGESALVRPARTIECSQPKFTEQTQFPLKVLFICAWRGNRENAPGMAGPAAVSGSADLVEISASGVRRRVEQAKRRNGLRDTLRAENNRSNRQPSVRPPKETKNGQAYPARMRISKSSKPRPPIREAMRGAYSHENVAAISNHLTDRSARP